MDSDKNLARPIKSLSIEGFKSICSLEDFPLRDLNVLIGPNGAGKSNFVTFFGFLRELVEGRLQTWVARRGGSDRILSYGVKETAEIRAQISFGDNKYAFTLSPTDDEKLYFSREDLIYAENVFSIWPVHFEAEVKDHTKPGKRRRADYIYASVASWLVYHFHDTSSTAGMKRWGALHDNAYLRPDASNLAAFLHMLKRRHAKTYSQIVKTIRLAIPFFDDFVLQPRELGPDEYQVMLRWRQNDSDYSYLPSQLSDGSLRFICLVTALLQPDPPATIILDEPELGLHPYAIHLLGALLRSASKRMQVIVATQSTLLLDEFAVDDLIVVQLQNGASVFKRLEEKQFDEWLKEFSVGELWHQNVLGGGIP